MAEKPDTDAEDPTAETVLEKALTKTQADEMRSRAFERQLQRHVEYANKAIREAISEGRIEAAVQVNFSRALADTLAAEFPEFQTNVTFTQTGNWKVTISLEA